MSMVDELFGGRRERSYHGRYAFRPESQLLEHAGEFAMLKVHDLETTSSVTLKVYRLGDLPDESVELAKSMWQAEVRILSQLVPYQWRRPGLVQFIEAGYDEPTNSLFVVWEDAYRLNLQQILEAPQLTPPVLEQLDVRISLLRMLCEALFELHGHGIIHREIRPGNICVWEMDRRVRNEPRAALTQFGMSAFVNSFLWAPSPDRFRPRKLHVETLRYSAPERLAFLAGNAMMLQPGEDYRQDFYSLGVSFIEWFAGKTPDEEVRSFLSEERGYDEFAHMEWIQGALAERVRAAHVSNDEEIAGALKKLLLDMVAFLPDDRVQTAGQLLPRAHDLHYRVRRRSYAEMCKQPFKIVFDPNTTAPHLDIAHPREDGSKWSKLRPPEMKAQIQALIAEDLRDCTIRVGKDPSRSFGRAQRSGTDRWLLRGRSHLYRLEIFTEARAHGVCPWIAYVFQVVHGSPRLSDMAPVPFRDVRVFPIQEVGEHLNRGTEPRGVGNWAALLSALDEARGEELERRVAHDVMLEALEEIVGIQEAEPEIETYAVSVIDAIADDPRDPLGPAVLALALDGDANERLLDAQPYAAGFERTRSARASFADWVDGLRRLRPPPRMHLAGELADLRRRRTLVEASFNRIEEVSGEPVLWVKVPDRNRQLPSQLVIRVGVDQEDTIRRQRHAIEQLRGDRFLLDLFLDPGTLNVPVPGVCEGWITIQDPDANKRAAVSSCLQAHPIFVIQGPPGTGKTVTATEVIAQILAGNPASRILVCAQANEALDNLLTSVIEGLGSRAGVQVLRVPSGRYRSADPDVQAREPGRARDRLIERALRNSGAFLRAIENNDSFDAQQRSRTAEVADAWRRTAAGRHSEIERLLYQSSNLVFATCVGIPRVDRFEVERFDWVVVEEAARAHATELAIPLLRGNRWLLIGDHLQLEPFKHDVFKHVFADRVKRRVEARGREAEALGLSWDAQVAMREIERSDRFLALFSHLFTNSTDRQHKTLTACYRMHPQICELVDRLFYRDPESPEQRVLEPLVTAEDRAHRFGVDGSAPAWLAGRAVVWLDTSGHRYRRDERPAGDTSVENALEAEIVERLLERLAPAKLEVMLLTVYRRQQGRLARIAARFDGAAGGFERCRALTIMASQGKEADVVALSLVRSNTAHTAPLAVGEIRKPSALNVALSRAKRLLLLVGDLEHFSRFGGSGDDAHVARLTQLLRAWPDTAAASRVAVVKPDDIVPRDFDPSEVRS